MVEDPVAEPLEGQEVPEEEEGGPVKSFLEHLEDLRWVLIKSLVAAGVAMLICLIAGHYVLRILEWPLQRAPSFHRTKAATVTLKIGTNELTSPLKGSQFASMAGKDSSLELQFVPLPMGTNHAAVGLPGNADGSGTNATLLLGVVAKRVPIAPPKQTVGVEIINLSPAGAFIVATKAAFFGGLGLASPFIFYFVAQFVFPALKMREKKYIYRGLGFAFGLFAIGVSFCYFVLMPVALAASVKYADWLGMASTQWRAEDYISFVCKFMLGMGLGFELPVVILTLVKLGLLSYKTLASARRYVIVINFTLGALLTTPEVITQVLMALPLQLLFEVSVWIAWYWERQEKKREAAETAVAVRT
jgi:sec-independent protein translocase protein TatC